MEFIFLFFFYYYFGVRFDNNKEHSIHGLCDRIGAMNGHDQVPFMCCQNFASNVRCESQFCQLRINDIQQIPRIAIEASK